MRFKAKVIRAGGRGTPQKGWLYRLSFYLKNGSIKIHLIVGDDKDEPHTHPWDFTSFLILPYKEEVIQYMGLKPGEVGLSDVTIGYRHKMFSIVRRTHDQYHRTRLYRFMGIPIPALTIGRYSKKHTLCSFCKDLGYCKQTGKPIP